MAEYEATTTTDGGAASRGVDAARLMAEEHAARAARIRAGRVSVVGHGVDTIHLSVWAPIAPGVRDRLQALRGAAERNEKRVVVGHGGQRWILAPHGAAGGFRWVLDGPWMTAKLRAGDTAGQAAWFVEVRSAWLWRVGVDAVVSEVQALARAWAPSSWRGDVRVTVARVDLAADFQGWVPSGRELLAVPCEHCGRRPGVAFVTRAVWRGIWLEAERARWGAELGDEEAEERGAAFKAAERGAQACEREARTDALWFRGQSLTGFSFGRGEVAGRLYDKTAEIRHGGKLWFHGLWQDAGYDPGAPVWRLEFQLRGEALRRGVLAVVEPGRGVGVATGSDWPVVRRALDGIWSTMTGRDGPGWLSARDPSTAREGRDGSHRSRWQVRPEWEALAAVRFGRAAQWLRTYPKRAPSVAQTWAAESPRETIEARPQDLEPLRPEGVTWDPDLRRLVREAGRPGVVAVCSLLRTDDDSGQRRAGRQIGAMLAAEKRDQLWAQTFGTVLTFAAATLAEKGHAAPEGDDDARRLVMATVHELFSAGGGRDAPATRMAAELRLRAARLPTIQAIRADLATAVGTWHEASA